MNRNGMLILVRKGATKIDTVLFRLKMHLFSRGSVTSVYTVSAKGPLASCIGVSEETRGAARCGGGWQRRQRLGSRLSALSSRRGAVAATDNIALTTLYTARGCVDVLPR